jgi:hypothetical protein
MILEIAAQKEHDLALSWMCSHLCGIITPRAVASCLRVILEHVLQSVFLLFLALALKKPFMLGLHDTPKVLRSMLVWTLSQVMRICILEQSYWLANEC